MIFFAPGQKHWWTATGAELLHNVWVPVILQSGPAKSTTVWRSLMQVGDFSSLKSHHFLPHHLNPCANCTPPHPNKQCEISPPLRNSCAFLRDPWCNASGALIACERGVWMHSHLTSLLPWQVRGPRSFKDWTYSKNVLVLMKTSACCDRRCGPFFLGWSESASSQSVQLWGGGAVTQAISRGWKKGRIMYPCNGKKNSCMPINLKVVCGSSRIMIIM